MKKREKLSEEKKVKIQALQKMMQNPFSEKLKEIIEALKPYKDGLPLADFAKIIKTSENGIRTVIASTKSQKIIIFPMPKGELEEYYIKFEAVK